MRVINITHGDDIDGVFCSELLKLVYSNIEVIYCNYKQLLGILQDLIARLKTFQERPLVYITDLSIGSEALKDSVVELKSLCDDVIIIDHHKGSERLVNFNTMFASSLCCVKYYNKRVSATKLVLDYLKDFLSTTTDYYNLETICQAISDWDTWEWKSSQNMLAKQIATLYSSNPYVTVKLLTDIILNNATLNSITSLSEEKEAILETEFLQLVNTVSTNSNCNGLEVTHLTLPIDKSIGYYLPAIDTLMDNGIIKVLLVIDGTVLRITSNKYDITPVLNHLNIPLSFMRINNIALDMETYIKLQLTKG